MHRRHHRALPGRIPLAWVLVVPFVVQLLSVVGVVGYLSLRNGERTVEALAQEMMHEVCQRAALRLRGYFAQPLLINQINANAIRSGQVDLEDSAAIETMLFDRLQEFDEVSGILVGTEAGDFRAATRRGQLRLVANDLPNNPSQIQGYALTDDGVRQRLIQSFTKAYIQNALWYRTAAEAQTSVWSPVFQTGDNQNLSLNANLPIFDNDGALLGVASAGIVLSVIDDFLSDFKVGQTGVIFVVDHDGLLLGSSTDSAIYDRQWQGGKVTLQRINALDSSHPLIRATATAVAEQSHTAAALNKISTFKISHGNEPVFVEAAPFRDLNGLELMIVVAVPQRDLMGQIPANTRNTIYLCVAATAVAIALGWLTARWIARPVRRLSQASAGITGGQFGPALPASSIQELNQLVGTFNQMSQDIQTYSNSLEEKVTARTAALEQEVCDRKQMEHQLAQAKATAERANRAKSEFLASMSHELRTPLNAILGFTQLMSYQGPVDQRHRDYLDIINQSGNHLLTLINNVLDMSKIEANCLEAHYTSVDIPALVYGLEDLFALKAEAKQVVLHCHIDSDVPHYLCSDDGKLRQILTNLLANAIRFTEQGCITLKVSLMVNAGVAPPPPSSPVHDATSRRICFEVKDTGIGMTEAELKQIFVPFTQTEAGQDIPGGTGLGLTISQQFAQLLGGYIEVESTPRLGSCFRVILPAFVMSAPEVRPTTWQQSRSQMTQLAPCRLLVAEDQPENRYLLEQLLTIPSLELKQVENGQACLDLWQRWQPHIILMDLAMPVMDGYEATRRIKATVQGQSTVVIAVTSYAFEENRRAAIEAGCDDFIRKPLQLEQLLSKLMQHRGPAAAPATDAQGERPPSVTPLLVGASHAAPDPSELLTMDHSSVAAEAVMPEPTSAVVRTMDWHGLPPDWIGQLQQAAYACNDVQVMTVLAGLPEERSGLRQQLTKLAEAFQFEQIIALTTTVLAPLQEDQPLSERSCAPTKDAHSTHKSHHDVSPETALSENDPEVDPKTAPIPQPETTHHRGC
ncbi:MAG: response regulator [Cyanobacteria bacterium J06632_22]